MGLVIGMVLGAFIGWLLAAVEELDEGILARLGVGLLGGVIGSFAAGMLAHESVWKLGWLSVVFSIAGAITLLVIARGTASYNSRDYA